jgi:hypothetical protein
MYEYTPRFHVRSIYRSCPQSLTGLKYKQDVDFFSAMYKVSSKLGKAGKHDCLRIINHSDYVSMTHGDILALLANHHILVVNGPVSGRKFNKAGLGDLLSAKNKIVIHGTFVVNAPNSPNLTITTLHIKTTLCQRTRRTGVHGTGGGR